MTRTMFSVIGTGLLTAVFQLSAQAPEPPKVLLIVREDIKEGKSAAHEKSEAKVAQAMAKNKYPAYYLGMTNLTGANQAWFMEAHDSFVSVTEAQAFAEKMPEFETLDATDSEYRSASHAWLAVYRPDLSFHAAQGQAALPKARYFDVTTIRVRLGRDPEFVELVKTALNTLEKVPNEQPLAMYQVVSGMPIGTYLMMQPRASLKFMDEAPANRQAEIQAMGGESEFAKFLKTAGDLIATEDPILLSLNPKMSYVSKTFAAGDPDFWTPAPAKAVIKKPPEKTTAAK